MTPPATLSGISITMPEWSEDALILSVRPHGENSAVVSVLTPEQGRHAGLVRGGNSSRLRGVLQPGNRVRATGGPGWKNSLGRCPLNWRSRYRRCSLMIR